MRRLLSGLFVLPCFAFAISQEPKQPDTPKGTTFSLPFSKSKVAPGTNRNVTIGSAGELTPRRSRLEA